MSPDEQIAHDDAMDVDSDTDESDIDEDDYPFDSDDGEEASQTGEEVGEEDIDDEDEPDFFRQRDSYYTRLAKMPRNVLDGTHGTLFKLKKFPLSTNLSTEDEPAGNVKAPPAADPQQQENNGALFKLKSVRLS